MKLADKVLMILSIAAAGVLILNHAAWAYNWADLLWWIRR
jgi:hypothetical protein